MAATYKNFTVRCQLDVEVSAVESEQRAKRIVENGLKKGDYAHIRVTRVVVQEAKEKA
jgi:hypothetical protein